MIQVVSSGSTECDSRLGASENISHSVGKQQTGVNSLLKASNAEWAGK